MKSPCPRATLLAVACAAGLTLLVGTPAIADNAYEAPMREFAEKTVKQWVSDPAVIEAINAQNAKNAGLTQADVDALDKKWRAEVTAASHPMIDGVLGTAVSKKLADAEQAAGGLVTEIFIMDDKGLNVAQSEITSDYWQGDEAKWQKTYSVGPDAIFIDDVEQDESTQTFQSQLSMTISDPATGKAIGAITVGINVDKL
ncbi:hypothetical protein [Radicibacter daui]|uniref:hypothetical protein n=1 Tax=Radicibacter daui TaxID=3064829 RepID=UPI004046D465